MNIFDEIDRVTEAYKRALIEAKVKEIADSAREANLLTTHKEKIEIPRGLAAFERTERAWPWE